MVFRTELLNLIFDFRLGLQKVFFLANHKRDYQKWRHQHSGSQWLWITAHRQCGSVESDETQDESNSVWFDLVRLGSVWFGLIFKYASYSCPEESDKLSQSVSLSVYQSVCRAAKRVGLRRRPSPWARIKCAQDFGFFSFRFSVFLGLIQPMLVVRRRFGDSQVPHSTCFWAPFWNFVFWTNAPNMN